MPYKYQRRGHAPPVIAEPHPKNYTGPEFITAITYRDEVLITIIDDSDNEQICAYVLDLCSPTGVDEKWIFDIATEWHEDEDKNYPISIEFSRLGISQSVYPIYRTFKIQYIMRLIGLFPKFELDRKPHIKRKKRKVSTIGEPGEKLVWNFDTNSAVTVPKRLWGTIANPNK